MQEYMNIDLDLSHYSQKDLERIFEVSPHCSAQELDKKEATILSKLIHLSMDTSQKSEIETFVKKAKNKLLIPKHVEPFVYSNPSDYFQGTLNPVEKRIITRAICIDSLFRPNYATTTSSDFIYQFPEYRKNVVSMRVAAIELPNFWYMFSQAANTNTFSVTQGTTKTVTISEGNYTAEVFNIQHQTIPTLSAGKIEVNSFTSKTVISSSNPFTVNFSIPSRSLKQTCGWMLGFRAAQYTSTLNGSLYEVVSESSFGSTVDSYVFLEIDDYQSNCVTESVISITNSGYIGNNIIARIPITTNHYSTVMNNTSDGIFKTRDYFGPVCLERLKIRLLNRFGEVIQNQGNDFSLSLEIKELYS